MIRQIAVLSLSLLAFFPTTLRAEDAPEKKAVVFTLSGLVEEQDSDMELNIPLFGSDQMSIGVRELARRLKLAAESDQVSGVLLIVNQPALEWEHLAELRDSIKKIKAAGKPLIATAEELDTLPYLLASAADKVYLNPDGGIMLTGIHARQWFLKGTLDKLGIQADMMHVGAYKGAAEPLLFPGPSKELQEMMNWLIDDWYAQLCEQVGAARGKDAAAGKAWIEKGPYTAKQALAAGLIDGIKTKAEVVEEFRKATAMKDEQKLDTKFGQKKAQTIDFGNPFAIFQLFGQLAKAGKKEAVAKPVVGVIYAEGTIMSGRTEDGVIGADSLVNEIEKARRDANVKAVVLRINSPGGSALASEAIHNALLKLKAEKPLVVSMGTVAGSGGYYIAVPAERIFAHPTSIVGSIGVVGGKLVMKGFFDWIGMSSHPYTRGSERAGLLDSSTKFSPAEKEWFMSMMNETYDLFAKHVKEGRGERLKDFEKISGGRVYTGRQAVTNGLIDEVGDLNAAVAWTAKKVGLNEFDFKILNKKPDPTLKLLRGLSGQDDEAELIPPSRVSAPSLPPEVETKIRTAFAALSVIDRAAAGVLQRQVQMLRLMSQQKMLLMMPFEITK
ncbi:MAG TPA: signal peptide peptidase SppA [Planctomycetota bacterium]|nr:signal peptide peptidase SppA [Planctomycetota bacterium]